MITCTFENGNVAKPGLRHVTTSALVIKDGQLLMGLRAPVVGLTMLESGKWGLLGGFFDRDENLLTAIKREVMEESGWEIDDIQLFRINDNPNRPKEDRQNLEMVFIARGVRQTGKSDKEVAKLQWFPLNALPPKEQIAFDHGDNIELYKKYVLNPHPLPLLD